MKPRVPSASAVGDVGVMAHMLRLIISWTLLSGAGAVVSTLRGGAVGYGISKQRSLTTPTVMDTATVVVTGSTPTDMDTATVVVDGQSVTIPVDPPADDWADQYVPQEHPNGQTNWPAEPAGNVTGVGAAPGPSPVYPMTAITTPAPAYIPVSPVVPMTTAQPSTDRYRLLAAAAAVAGEQAKAAAAQAQGEGGAAHAAALAAAKANADQALAISQKAKTEVQNLANTVFRAAEARRKALSEAGVTPLTR